MTLEFTEDKDHYDVNEVYGLKLPKAVPLTKWSSDAASVGKDPLELKLVDFMFHGAGDYSFRLLANGTFMLPSVPESRRVLAGVRAVEEGEKQGDSIQLGTRCKGGGEDEWYSL